MYFPPWETSICKGQLRFLLKGVFFLSVFLKRQCQLTLVLHSLSSEEILGTGGNSIPLYSLWLPGKLRQYNWTETAVLCLHWIASISLLFLKNVKKKKSPIAWTEFIQFLIHSTTIERLLRARNNASTRNKRHNLYPVEWFFQFPSTQGRGRFHTFDFNISLVNVIERGNILLGEKPSLWMFSFNEPFQSWEH